MLHVATNSPLLQLTFHPGTLLRPAFSASHHHVPGAPVENFGVTEGRANASQ